jgi:folate-dependent phosphoribosylglycinamide formyltransferase PurN
MKVWVIADDSPGNTWLLHHLASHGLINQIVRPDWSRPAAARPQSTASPISTAKRLRRAVRRWYFRAVDDAAARALAVAFSSSPPIAVPVRDVAAGDINGAELESLLRAAAPDVLLVSGAPLLSANIHTIPRWGTLNVHYGISSRYRGLHTLTVPWWRGEYEAIGATIHRIDDGVDTGAVLMEVYPPLHAHDTAGSAEVALTHEVAHALVALLQESARAGALPRGAVPRARGALIRFGDRSIREHARYV